MNWFGKKDVGKRFKIYWESGKESEGILLEIGDINVIELKTGEIKRFKEKSIESLDMIEHLRGREKITDENLQSSLSPISTDNTLKAFYQSVLSPYERSFVELDLDSIIPPNENTNDVIRLEILSLLNKLKNAKKINELFFKFSRTDSILKNANILLSGLKIKQLIYQPVLEKIVIYILSKNDTSYYDFFNVLPKTRQCILYDAYVHGKRQESKVLFETLKTLFLAQKLISNVKNEWFYVIQNIVAYQDLSVIAVQAEKYLDNFDNETRSLFANSIKYIIEKSNINLNTLYSFYMEKENLSVLNIKELVSLLNIKVKKTINVTTEKEQSVPQIEEPKGAIKLDKVYEKRTRDYINPIHVIHKASTQRKEEKPKKYTNKADFYLYLNQKLKKHFSEALNVIKLNKEICQTNKDTFTRLVKNKFLTSYQQKEIQEATSISWLILDSKKAQKLDEVPDLFYFVQHYLKSDFEVTVRMIELNLDLIEGKEVEYFNLIKTIAPHKIRTLEKKNLLDTKKIEEIKKYINPKIKEATAYIAAQKWKEAVDVLKELYEKDKLPLSKLSFYAEALGNYGDTENSIKVLESEVRKCKNVSDKFRVVKQLSYYYSQAGNTKKAIIILYGLLDETVSEEEQVSILVQIILLKSKTGAFDEIEDDLRKVETIDKFNSIRSKVKEFKDKYESDNNIEVAEDINALLLEESDYSTEFNSLNQFIQFYESSCEYKGVSAKKAQMNTYTQADYDMVTNLEDIKSSKEKADRTLTAVMIAKELGSEEEIITIRMIESLRYQANYYIQNNRYDIAKSYLLAALHLQETSDKSFNDMVNDYLKTALRIDLSQRMGLALILDKLVNTNETNNLFVNLRLFARKSFDRVYTQLEQNKELFEEYKRRYNIEHLADDHNDVYRKIDIDLKTLSRMKIGDERVISKLQALDRSFLFELDKKYFEDFIDTMEKFLEVHQSQRYMDKELVTERSLNALERIDMDIRKNPAIFSINNLLGLVNEYKNKIEQYSVELKKSNLPHITIAIPLEKYTKVKNSFNFHLALGNGENLSPASNIDIELLSGSERLEIIQVDKLLGGDNKTLEIPLKTKNENTFSITAKILYDDVLNNRQTVVENFVIQFETDENFIEISSNPYYPDGDGTPRHMIFGRDEFVSKLTNMLLDGSVGNLLLYGQKRSGKSTVFELLQEKMDEEGSTFLAVYFQMKGTQEAFLRRLTREISRVYERRYQQPLFETLSIDQKTASEDLIGLSEFLDELKDLLEEKNVRLLIMIDEFTFLYSQIKAGKFPTEFLKEWRGLIRDKLFASALIAQNSMPQFIKAYPNELGVYKKIEITYLDRESALALIIDPIRLADGSSRYKEESEELIYKYSNGSPYYIQKICHNLVEHINERKSIYITRAHIINVINEMYESMRLHSDFENLFSIGDGAEERIEQLRKDVLIRIAHKSKHIGKVSFDDIDLDVEESLKREVVNSLVDTNVIAISDQRYFIVVKLFEEFLQKKCNIGD